jgi:pimeloyl-ACP methyl ester carboxylesterase
MRTKEQLQMVHAQRTRRAFWPDARKNAFRQLRQHEILFHDRSSWSKIVPLLKAKGFRVTTAGNPLTSFADDVAATRRAIAAQDGPTVLVGHSYGGVVITEAGNDPRVVSLVYVAAFAPDAGQSIGEISQAFAKPAGADQLQPQPDGFLQITRSR